MGPSSEAGGVEEVELERPLLDEADHPLPERPSVESLRRLKEVQGRVVSPCGPVQSPRSESRSLGGP